MQKTNAARLLDARQISYELIEYEVDEEDLSAITLAGKINQAAGRIFKTLVLRGDKSGVFVAVVPGDGEVNLKKAAKITGNKNTAMVQVKELQDLTGYIRGGCSPLGLKKPYPVYIHESCRNYDFIFVSAGKRGIQLRIKPEDLIKVTSAIVCDLIF